MTSLIGYLRPASKSIVTIGCCCCHHTDPVSLSSQLSFSHYCYISSKISIFLRILSIFSLHSSFPVSILHRLKKYLIGLMSHFYMLNVLVTSLTWIWRHLVINDIIHLLMMSFVDIMKQCLDINYLIVTS